MLLTSLSFTYPEAAAHERGDLVLPAELRKATQGQSSAMGRDVFMLATCLRVELAWLGGPEETPQVLSDFYPLRSGFPSATTRTDGNAFLHLCRVAAGLESPQIGELEVLGQFRQAVSELGSVSQPGGLQRVVDAAVGVGRAVRRKLPEMRGSLASAAVKALEGRGPVAVIGGGAMARATVEQLNGSTVSVFTRRPMVLAGHESRPWEALRDDLSEFRAVVSTVPGGSENLVDGVIGEFQEPTIIIDLGMPPGVPRAAFREGLTYLGIDELAVASTELPAPEADANVEELAAATWSRLSASDGSGAVIAAVMALADKVVREEVARSASKLKASDNPDEVMAQVARVVARRVLHSPVSFLGVADDDQVATLAEAFGIEE